MNQPANTGLDTGPNPNLDTAPDTRSNTSPNSSLDSGANPSSNPSHWVRDAKSMEAQLRAWLSRHVEAPQVRIDERSLATGMSSETVLFDYEWVQGGQRKRSGCVLRMPPLPGTRTLFPVYDLDRQQRIMRLIAERSSVPVPRIHWYEDDSQWLGAPFFVMERREGLVPGDSPPYVFQSFLTEGTAEQVQLAEQETVRIIADLHGIPLRADDRALLDLTTEGDTPLRRHFDDLLQHYEWVCREEGFRSPLLERAHRWLSDNWPENEGDQVVLWGDARVGNVMYQDYRPVAAFDWECATIGPPEYDVCWLVMFHGWMQDLAARFGLPGMPGFLRLSNVVAAYEALTGRQLKNLEFYLVYANTRLGPIMQRSMMRAVQYDHAPMPESTEDLITHRAGLEKLLAGETWPG